MAGYIIFGERGAFEGFSETLKDDMDSSYVPIGPIAELICRKQKKELALALQSPDLDLQESISPLYVAFLCKDKEAVLALLSKNVPPLSEVQFSNVCSGDLFISCMDEMYKHKQVTPSKADLFLCYYVNYEKQKNANIIRKIFTMGANPNALHTVYTSENRDGFKRPLLFPLVHEGELEIVKAFVEKGANVNVVNENGISLLRYTAQMFLHFASNEQLQEHKKITRFLLKHNAKFEPPLTFMEKIKFYIFGRL